MLICAGFYLDNHILGPDHLLLTLLPFCSFADLQKPQLELDGKACAAVGQNGLMALYDVLFSQA